MKFLAKDVNKSLLVLIIFFLILFITFTIYYESVLRNTSAEKSQYDKKFGELTSQLVLEKLSKSAKLNEIALIDKTSLEEKYSDLAAQNENLKKEKMELQEEITLLKSELEYHKVKLDGPVAQFRLIQNKNQQISQLKEKIDALCSRLKYNNFSEKECD
ncbi:MAG: hypothetical protein Q8R04_02895 [Nanoarchaeota archaeon]|nr:hypothetical protein [Nanoarchaeota archaeon]